MRAVVFEGPLTMRRVEREMPMASNGEMVIRVAACGICGTDQHIFHGKPGSAVVQPPMVLGHELAGTVVALGEGVEGFSPGDRVTVDPNIYCGSCRFCQEGRPHLCEHLKAVGVTRDGGMAEYCVVPSANCYVLPDSLTFEQGAMIEPLGCCLHGLSLITVRPGRTALVIGGGYIGLMMVQLLHRLGASSIIVCEPDEKKRELALRFGAHAVVSPTDVHNPIIDAPARLSGADIVIECVGRTETMQQAVNQATRGGQILLFGVADPSTMIQLSPFEVFSKELTIHGSFINPHTHSQAIALVRDGHVRIDELISHRFQLDDVPEIMARYPQMGVTKGIIRFESA